MLRISLSFVFLVNKFLEVIHPVLLEALSTLEIGMLEDFLNGRSTLDVLAHALLEQIIVLFTSLLNLLDRLLHDGTE